MEYGFIELEWSVQQKLLKTFATLRILRTFKVFKLLKYSDLLFKMVETLKFKPTQTRILIILGGALLLVHIFSCVFYLQARYKDFEGDTWVSNRGNIDASGIQAYSFTLYWAF